MFHQGGRGGTGSVRNHGELRGARRNRNREDETGNAGLRRNLGQTYSAGSRGTPDDVARVIVFFASDAARAFVNGQTLWVDGGLFSKPAWPY